MNLGSIAAKLQNKTEKIKEKHARDSSLREEKVHDAQARFDEEVQETICDLRRFVESNDFQDAMAILKVWKDYEELYGKSIAEEILERLQAKEAKIDKTRERLVRVGSDSAFEKLRAFNDKHYFPLQEEIKRVGSLNRGGVLYMRSLFKCELTYRGFGKDPEEVVTNFSEFGNPDRHPSRLLSFIEEELRERAQLFEQL